MRVRAATLGLFLALAGLSGRAEAARAWRIELSSGAAVMSEISPLAFQVTNTSTAGERLSEVTLAVSDKTYDIDGGSAPVGWSVSAIDKRLRQVTYVSNDPCAGGLAAGQSLAFELRLIGVAGAADVSGETLAGKTAARDACSNNTFPAPSSTPTWKRVGLKASVNAVPRSLAPGESITVTTSILNDSTIAQFGITPAAPSVVGDAQFLLSSGPTPASLSLASGVGGTFTWTFTAVSTGRAVFVSSAKNALVSSPDASSLQVNVGNFPAATSLSTDSLVSGQTLDVALTVSNNGGETAQNVVPSAPTVNGNVTATLVSGPSPASIASLPGDSATSFRWTYRITGAVGATFTFTAQATATRAGAAISSDPVLSATGKIVSDSVTANPSALLQGSTNRTIAYTVFNGGSVAIDQVTLLAPDKSVFVVASAPFSADTSGWNTGGNYVWTAPTIAARIAPGTSKTFTFLYARVGPVAATETFSHKFSLREADGDTIRIEAPVTLFVARTLPEVSTLTAVSGNGRNTLVWNNPSDHDGVLVLRAAGATPNTSPVQGTTYKVGDAIGNATVAYVDASSFVSSFVDSGLTNGTRYVYRVFNHDPYFIYATGAAANGAQVASTPTARVSPAAQWCYTVGGASNQQPFSDAGNSVLTSGQTGLLTSSALSGTESLDGTEKWRPVAFKAPVGNRVVVPPVAMKGWSSKAILTGDQTGRAYLINPSDGRVLWTGNGGAPLGDRIQAQPQFQITSAGAYDRAFFATSNSSATNNKVYSLKSTDGSVEWTYAPGDLDVISGVMYLDGTNNRLWVTARAGNGYGVRVLDSTTGAELARVATGSIDTGAIPETVSGLVFVVSNAGTVYGIDRAAPYAIRFSQSVGAPSHYVVPIGNGTTTPSFVVPLKSGSVQRWDVNLSVAPVTVVLGWSLPVASPSGLTPTADRSKAYVGSSDGTIHRLALATGVDEAKLPVVTGAGVGMPSLDTGDGRLNVGTLDGRICSMPLSF